MIEVYLNISEKYYKYKKKSMFECSSKEICKFQKEQKSTTSVVLCVEL